MANKFFTVKKGPPKKVNKLKPTCKVVQFRFGNFKKAKPLKLRFGSTAT